MAVDSGTRTASAKAKAEFATKYRRARLMEKGLSRAAIDRYMKRLAQNDPDKSGARFVAVPKPKEDKRSPYRKWASQEWKNTKPGQKAFVPDNGKSPWRNFTEGGGSAKILKALTLNQGDRQERYRNNRRKNAGVDVSKEAIRRRLAAARNQKNTTGR